MLLVDGHNLIPRLPGLSLKDIDDEHKLIEMLKIYCQVERRDVEVYFDGAPPGFARQQRYGRLTAHYIRQGASADNAIRVRLEQLGKNARGVTVVSDDRQVQAEARAHQATVVPSTEFARRLLAAQQPVKKSAAEKDERVAGIQDWLDLFGGEPQDNVLPEPRIKRSRMKKKSPK